MHSFRHRFALFFCGLTAPGVALAQLQPVANSQPSIVMTQVVDLSGEYPTQNSGLPATGDTLGFIYTFAGNFAPGGTVSAQGQLIPIPQSAAGFSILGTSYGGNGVANYALPNLAGRAIVGATSGNLGSVGGSNSITFTDAQIPGGSSSTSSFDNRQPSLGLTPLIAVSGNYPDSHSSQSTFIGQVANFTGNFAPSGWMVADGSVLQISANEELFSVIGTTYGGDGETTFALPNLIGRVAVGSNYIGTLGATFGENSTVLTAANLPTGNTPGALVNNDQASIALNFLISLSGVFPSRDGLSGFDADIATLGQVVAYSGSSAPSGWAFANGQTLSIAQNSALFALLGTTYGGNGSTTFMLPDLRGRTIVGAGSGYPVGTRFGSDTFALVGTVAATPSVPEPTTWAMMLFGFAGIGFTLRRRRSPIALAQLA